MPEPKPVGAPLVEKARGHSENAEPKATPSYVDALGHLEYLETNLYKEPHLVPERLANKSALLAFLVAEGRAEYRELFTNSLTATRREARRLDEAFVPHLSWPKESYLDIFIHDKNIAPSNDDESEVSLNSRRGIRERVLLRSLSSVRTKEILELLDTTLEDKDKLLQATGIEYIEQAPSTARNEKILQANSALEASKKQSGEPKRNLLNLALDISTASLESLPEELSAERALAYLVASTSAHDLASQPNSFLPHIDEKEARDLRVYALEMSYFWIKQSADIYRELFGSNIGKITPQSLPNIQQQIKLVRENSQFINSALWFEGVYRNDYEQAVRGAENRKREIGREAVISALKSTVFNGS